MDAPKRAPLVCWRPAGRSLPSARRGIAQGCRSAARGAGPPSLRLRRAGRRHHQGGPGRDVCFGNGGRAASGAARRSSPG